MAGVSGCVHNDVFLALSAFSALPLIEELVQILPHRSVFPLTLLTVNASI